MNEAGTNAVRITEQKILDTIAQYEMLPRDSTVVIGLSGGADSMTLAHFLFFHRKELGISAAAAHINHGIRGAESDADEAFVRRWCEKIGLPLRVLHADVPALAKQRGQGWEECGRAVRYEFFARVAGELGNARIATAHTLSDNAETVLLNLTRGAGIHGLCGIPPVREGIVRPLLEITRRQTEEYCAYHRLSYVTDSTNLERTCARNVIRLDVSPILMDLNPGFEQSIARMTASLRQDDAYLSGLAEQALKKAGCPGGWRLEELRELPQPVLVRVVRQALNTVSTARQDSSHLLGAVRCIQNGGEQTVAGGVLIRARKGVFSVAVPGAVPEDWRTRLILPETRLPDGRILRICEVKPDGALKKQKFNNLLFHNWINYATIRNDICVRNRRAGDVFRPAGRGVTKSLKKLFNEAGIPPAERSRLTLLESRGEIVWIEGFGVSQSACPQEGQRIGEIIIKECSDHDS